MVEIALVWLAVVQTLHVAILVLQGRAALARADEIKAIQVEEHRLNLEYEEREAATRAELERLRRLADGLQPVDPLPAPVPFGPRTRGFQPPSEGA